MKTKSESILWLQRFRLLWDECEDRKHDHLAWLCDIYERFTTVNELPMWSADELIYELQTGQQENNHD
tara:strand:+ start:829 stop:1032 length:204 start_codon:yes stop_codon:yes gene_type:complete